MTIIDIEKYIIFEHINREKQLSAFFLALAGLTFTSQKLDGGWNEKMPAPP